MSVRVPRTGRPRAGGPVCSRSAAVQGGPSSARRIHSRIHSAPAGVECWGPMRQCRRRVASAHGAPSQGAEWRLGSPSQSRWRGAWAQRPGTSRNTPRRAEWGSQPRPSRPLSGHVSVSLLAPYKALRGVVPSSPELPSCFSPSPVPAPRGSCTRCSQSANTLFPPTSLPSAAPMPFCQASAKSSPGSPSLPAPRRPWGPTEPAVEDFTGSRVIYHLIGGFD